MQHENLAVADIDEHRLCRGDHGWLGVHHPETDKFAMTRGWPYMIAAGGTALLVIGMLLWVHYASAQEQHGHTHEGALGRFYQSWKMPDNRAASCCNDEDCTPAASRLDINGKWEAQRDGEWVSIPEHKIETERDSPDGRSHLCGKRYNVFGKGGVTVFCFIAGSGT